MKNWLLQKFHRRFLFPHECLVHHQIQKPARQAQFSRPHVIVCRTEVDLTDEHLDKLAMFCNVPKECVIVEKDVETSIYEIPLVLAEQGVDELILNHFRIARPTRALKDWQKLIAVIKNPKGKVKIGVVGKYSELQDAYKSIYEALYHGGYAAEYEVEIIKFHAEEIEKNPDVLLGP